MIHEPIGKYIYLVWGLLLGALYGAWSDRIGRRTGMTIVSIGLVLFNFFNALDYDVIKTHEPIIPFLARFLVSLTSHYVIIYTLAYSYSADVTLQKNRLGRYVLLDIAFRISTILAGTSLLFLTFIGFSPILLTSINIGLLAAAVTGYSSETGSIRYKLKDSTKSKKSSLYELSWHFRDAYHTLTKHREYNSRSHLLIYILLFAFNDLLSNCITEITTVLTMKHPALNWDSVTVGEFRLVCELSLLVGSGVGWNIITQSSFSRFREPQFILIGLAFRLLQILPVLVTEASHEPYLMVAILGVFTSLIGPSILSHATSIVEPHEIGKVLGCTFGLSCFLRLLLEVIGKATVYLLADEPPNVVWGPILGIASLLFLLLGLNIRDIVKQYERRNRHRLLAKDIYSEELNSTGDNTPCEYMRKATGNINSRSDEPQSESIEKSDSRNILSPILSQNLHSTQPSTFQMNDEVQFAETPTRAESIDPQVPYANTPPSAKQPSNRFNNDLQLTTPSIVKSASDKTKPNATNDSINQMDKKAKSPNNSLTNLASEPKKNSTTKETGEYDENSYASNSDSEESDSCSEYESDSKNIMMIVNTPGSTLDSFTNLSTSQMKSESVGITNGNNIKPVSEDNLLKRRNKRIPTLHKST
ncbi:unnamed protein product [Dimorphilus gyrociliatus]|uniref:Uncharacterized protein n=1 Tax=Dimorphilus gyrociliatus TaxID=2664684 RepID=A0A7I8VSK5_9ANNE|nr:unnamed protein product [Dimorphilus gyrociliatus]